MLEKNEYSCSFNYVTFQRIDTAAASTCGIYNTLHNTTHLTLARIMQRHVLQTDSRFQSGYSLGSFQLLLRGVSRRAKQSA